MSLLQCSKGHYARVCMHLTAIKLYEMDWLQVRLEYLYFYNFIITHSGYIGRIALWLREEQETAGVLLANSNIIKT